MYLPLLRRTLLIVSLLTLTLSALGQNNPYNEVSIASPTVGSLGKFVEYPVNFHTGVPDITIPLYVVDCGNLKVPILLNYHASGLRVMEPSSWVGAGWSLSAGGFITRTVRGAPDERNTSTVFDQNKGYYSDKGYSSYYYINNNVQDWQAFAAGRSDGEPDKFFFNFGGYSGKFYFGDDQRPVLESKQDINITANYLNSGSISSFVVETPDGTQYNFGSNANGANSEITNPFTIGSGFIEGTAISTWYLNSIQSADSTTKIDFIYTPEQYSYYTISTPPIASTATTNTQDARLVKNYVNGVRLSQIVFDNGVVNLNPGAVRTDLSAFSIKDMADYVNTDAKALGTIDITNNKGFCQKFIFYTSYFQDATTAFPSMLGSQSILTDTRRLRLDSIQEVSCLVSGNITKPPFKFLYHGEKVPRRLCFAQDHWGFFNGATGNSSMIPTYTEITPTTNNTISGANRETGWPAMRGGTLYRITYPTGGYTQFEYEPNRVPVSGGIPTYSNVLSNSIGFDGSNPILKTQTVTLAGGIYKGGIINSNNGSNASFYVYNPATGEYPMYVSASPGNTNTDQRFIGAGTYTIAIYKDCTTPGSMVGVGANGYLDLYTGTTGPPDTIVGGLRIKQMIQHDHLRNTDEVTDYSYTVNGISSGVLFGRPTYVQLLRNDNVAQYGNWSPAGGYTQSCSAAGCVSCNNFTYFKSGGTLQPLSTTNGYHIGYKEIKVSKPGQGYSIYRYNTDMPYGAAVSSVAIKEVNRTLCDYSTPNYPPRPEEFQYNRGTIKDELHFAQNGKLLKEVNYYNTYSQPSDSTPAFLATSIDGKYLGTFYDLFSIKKISTKTVQTDYSEQDPIDYVSTVTVTDYTSPYHTQAVKTATVNSVGDSLITRLKYAADYRYASCDAGYTCPTSYKSECNSCLATYSSAQTACSGQGSSCYTNAYLNYQKCLITARVNFSTCRINFYSPVGTFATCQNTARSNADDNLKPLLAMQLTGRNPIIELTKWSNNRLLRADFYHYSLEPGSTFKCYPVQIDKIEIATPSTNFSNSAAIGNTVTIDSRYQPQSTAAYKNGKLVLFKETDGKPISYIYDYLGQYPVAVIQGATEDQCAYTSFEATGQGNWTTVPNSGTTDNNALTGRRVYIFNGNNNISKAGLISSKTYIVSYWTRNSSPYSITGTQGTATKGVTVNGWTYFEHRITGINFFLIGNSGVIDELRLYPEGALMTTYTHDPLVGITTITDKNGQLLYYDYDPLGRLKSIQDREGNIKSYHDYQYQSSFVQ